MSLDDLVDLGRFVPVAREVLGLDDRWRWSQLELLWYMTQRRSWENVGVAASLFELAEAAADSEDLLAEYPHLLLSVRQQNLHVTSRGIWILGQHLATRPAADEIAWEWSADYTTA